VFKHRRRRSDRLRPCLDSSHSAAWPPRSLRAEVAGAEKQMRVLFASFFRRPVVGRVYEEAKAGTLK